MLDCSNYFTEQIIYTCQETDTDATPYASLIIPCMGPSYYIIFDSLGGSGMHGKKYLLIISNAIYNVNLQHGLKIPESSVFSWILDAFSLDYSVT